MRWTSASWYLFGRRSKWSRRFLTTFPDFRNLHEQDVRRDVGPRGSPRVARGVLLVAFEGDTPAESLRPEACEAPAVGGVDDDALGS